MQAFNGCSALKSIEVAEENKTYASREGVRLSKSCRELLYVPTGTEAAFSIPAGVEVVGKSALYGCAKLTSVKFPIACAR